MQPCSLAQAISLFEVSFGPFRRVFVRTAAADCHIRRGAAAAACLLPFNRIQQPQRRRQRSDLAIAAIQSSSVLLEALAKSVAAVVVRGRRTWVAARSSGARRGYRQLRPRHPQSDECVLDAGLIVPPPSDAALTSFARSGLLTGND